MNDSSATRMTLLARKGQLKLAEQGSSLLESKREALLKELLDLIKPLMKGHAKLETVMAHARQSLAFAEGLDGKPYLESLGMASGKKMEIEVDQETFWGVKIPATHPSRDVNGADYLFGVTAGVTSRAMETADDFANLAEAVLTLLPAHARLTRLGSEIRRTSRQVNALEQTLIPNIKNDIKRIGQALEEMEREDTFRLRRIKKKRT
ncbi:hypothetical protein BVX99_02965 [bacterium F16]|nr:hypothetical protein BVX99_02965 [bacterium F16]